MQKVMLTAQNAKKLEDMGLSDGGHVYPKCANCDAILLDIWRTIPDAVNPRTGKPFNWKLRANCPFCGDTSFEVEIEGVFHVGGYGAIKDDDEDDDIPSTSIDTQDFDSDSGTYIFNLVKATPDAKPVTR